MTILNTSFANLHFVEFNDDELKSPKRIRTLKHFVQSSRGPIEVSFDDELSFFPGTTQVASIVGSGIRFSDPVLYGVDAKKLVLSLDGKILEAFELKQTIERDISIFNRWQTRNGSFLDYLNFDKVIWSPTDETIVEFDFAYSGGSTLHAFQLLNGNNGGASLPDVVRINEGRMFVTIHSGGGVAGPKRGGNFEKFESSDATRIYEFFQDGSMDFAK